MLVEMALVATAFAIPGCKNVQFENQKYDLSDMGKTWVISTEINTPPSTTNLTWYYNPCGAVDHIDCPPKSQLCGVETVYRDGESEVTQIIPILTDANGAERIVDRPADGDGLRFVYSGGTWGDIDVRADVIFTCDSKSKFVGGEDSWQDGSLTLTFSTPSVCAERNDKPGSPQDPPKDDKPTRGFFGSILHFIWQIFVFFCVIAAVIGVLIFIRYRQTGQAPIHREDLNNLVRDLPYLARDFFRKVRETFGGSSRGYSAV